MSGAAHRWSTRTGGERESRPTTSSSRSGRSFGTATRSWPWFAATPFGTAAAGWPASGSLNDGAGAGSGSRFFSTRLASSTLVASAASGSAWTSENPTGATRLYERAGMRNSRLQSVTFEKSPRVSLRQPRDEEFDAILELMNAHQLAVFGKADVTAEELRTWLSFRPSTSQRDIRVLEQDGRLIGYVDTDDEEERTGALVVRRQGCARRRRRRRSSRSSSAGWSNARTRDCSACGRAPTTSACSRSTERTASTSHGTRTGWRSSCRRGSRALWPYGLRLRTFDPERRAPALRGRRRRLADTTGPIRAARGLSQLATPPELRPALWFLVYDGDELAAFELDNPDAVDPAAGYVTCSACAGLAEAGPRRGAAAALVRHLPRARLPRATLGVDAESPTGAAGLYERAGMQSAATP